MSLGELQRAVDGFADDARRRLPTLAPDVRFLVDDEPGNVPLPPGYGVGGYAESAACVRLVVDRGVELEPEVRLRRLHGAVLHESFHVVQGFTAETFRRRVPLTGLEHAVYEGCATVFERERARSEPPWGAVEDEETMRAWTAEVAALGVDYDWRRWKFFDPATRRPWILYRVGTFVVDRALARSGLRIEAFAHVPAAEIAGAAGLG